MVGEHDAPDYALGFAFTVFAGSATLLGVAVIPLLRLGSGAEHCLTAGALSFAAGVMMYVSFVDVLGEEAKEFFENHFADSRDRQAGDDLEDIRVRIWVAVFFFLGIVLTVLLDTVMDQITGSTRMEPGDSTVEIPGQRISANSVTGSTRATCRPSRSSSELLTRRESYSNAGLERISLIACVALTLHNFPEGLATFFGGGSGSFTVPFAIAMHNIPEGAAIAVPVYQSTGSGYRAVKATFIAGMAQPLGAAMGWVVIHLLGVKKVSEFVYGAMYSVTAGIMVCVSIVELIPEALHATSPRFVGICVFAGFAVMELSIILLQLADS